MCLKNAIVISTGRKASLSAQSCNLYLSSLGIEPRTMRLATQCFCPQYFFLTIFGLEFGFKPRVQGVGLDYTLRTVPLWTYICEDFFFLILRGCHIIQTDLRVVRWSSDPLPSECWDCRLTEAPPKAVKGSGFLWQAT